MTKETIERYDAGVAKLWKAICKGEIDNLSPSLQERWHQGKLDKKQALPNPKFPISPPRDTRRPLTPLEDPNTPRGEFYDIVKPYVMLKQKEQTAVATASFPTEEMQSVQNYFLEKDSENRTIMDNIDEEELEEEEIERRDLKMTPHFTHQQFRDSMEEDLERKTQPGNQEMLAWLRNKNNQLQEPAISYNGDTATDTPDALSYLTCRVPHQKYKSESLDIKYDNNNEIYEESPAYLYNPQTSYQHPFGRNDSSSERIKIDASTKKEGDLYRVGDSFYTEEGEFLYKIYT